MPELLWARVKGDAHYGLRRGAWYRVIRRTDREALLDVDHRPATVPRECLEFVSVRPDRWTIVERPSGAAGPVAAWGRSYGVCPSCMHRTPVTYLTPEARCPKCGGTFRVDWGPG